LHLLLMVGLSATTAMSTSRRRQARRRFDSNRCCLRLRHRLREGSDDPNDRAWGKGSPCLPAVIPRWVHARMHATPAARVKAASTAPVGNEITQADEAEYDKKVMRVRVGSW